MSEFDEFSLLREEATVNGLVWRSPAVERIGVADADGRRVSALRWGEESPRAVLLHGRGLNAHTWDATALALGVPLLAIDLPGHGDSDWRDDADYRPETIAPAVATAIDVFAPDARVVIGQSLGGLTALAIAATAPEPTGDVVLIDIWPGLQIGSGNPVRDFLAGGSDFASCDEIVERALEFGFGPDRRAVERGVLLNTRVGDDGRVVFKHHLANLGERAPIFSTDFGHLWPAAERLASPPALVRGSHGFLTDSDAEEYRRRLPGARVVTVEAGHNIQEDAPVDLARVLADLAGLSTTPDR